MGLDKSKKGPETAKLDGSEEEFSSISNKSYVCSFSLYAILFMTQVICLQISTNRGNICHLTAAISKLVAQVSIGHRAKSISGANRAHPDDNPTHPP